MIDKTGDQMNNSGCVNPSAFSDQFDRSNPQTTGSWKDKCTRLRLSLYGSDNLRVKIVPPSCRQYKPDSFQAVRPLFWNEIIGGNDVDDYWVDPGAPSIRRSCPSDGNGKNDG